MPAPFRSDRSIHGTDRWFKNQRQATSFSRWRQLAETAHVHDSASDWEWNSEQGWQSPSLQRLPERPFRMVGRPDYSFCSRNAKGMEPDDLLYSRNARSQTPLVGRAQWKINQPPSQKRTRACASEGQPKPLRGKCGRPYKPVLLTICPVQRPAT